MKIDILDYSIYGNNTDRISDRLIRAGLAARGHEARIVEWARDSTLQSLAPFVWLRYDLRTPADLQWLHECAVSFEKQGFCLFPPARSILLAEDKWETYKIFRNGNIPTVDTFQLEDGLCLKGACVIKPRVGWGGKGIELFDPDADTPFPITEGKHEYVCQPYIHHDRVFTVAVNGQSVIATIMTRSSGRDFRFDCEEGMPPVLVEAGGEMIFVAQRALGAVGLITGTVDIIEYDRAFYALEINSAPRIRHEALPDLDLAGPMVEGVLDWWMRRT